jgi:hypothetical protein
VFGAGVKGEFQCSTANGFAAQFNYQRHFLFAERQRNRQIQRTN